MGINYDPKQDTSILIEHTDSWPVLDSDGGTHLRKDDCFVQAPWGEILFRDPARQHPFIQRPSVTFSDIHKRNEQIWE